MAAVPALRQKPPQVLSECGGECVTGEKTTLAVELGEHCDTAPVGARVVGSELRFQECLDINRASAKRARNLSQLLLLGSRSTGEKSRLAKRLGPFLAQPD